MGDNVASAPAATNHERENVNTEIFTPAARTSDRVSCGSSTEVFTPAASNYEQKGSSGGTEVFKPIETNHEQASCRCTKVSASPATVQMMQCAPLHTEITIARRCCECNAAISDAVFMLNDRPYCCQRHRLAAYHKLERDRSKLTPRSRHVGETSGLSASFSSWI